MSLAFSIQSRLDDVTLDVQAEDVRRVRADLVGAGRELHAAGLAAPADLHLRLHDDRVADTLGRRDRLVDGVYATSPADTGMP